MGDQGAPDNKVPDKGRLSYRTSPFLPRLHIAVVCEFFGVSHPNHFPKACTTTPPPPPSRS